MVIQGSPLNHGKTARSCKASSECHSDQNFSLLTAASVALAVLNASANLGRTGLMIPNSIEPGDLGCPPRDKDGLDISLVICTRDRCSQLERCLRSLERIACSVRWELIVVNNGSTDGTEECLRLASLRGTLPLVQVSEKRLGLSCARNRGLSEASGRLVAFTDDDCYPAPDFLDQVVACFDEHEIQYLGGRALLFDENDARVCIQEQTEREFVEPRSFVLPRLIRGMNFAVERRALLRVGGFDERLGAGTRFYSAEDTDAIARMSWAGMRGLYDPRPIVYHHHGRRLAADIDNLSRGYSIGMGAYLLKFAIRKDSRWVYLRGWYSRAREGWRTRTLREFGGAIRFGIRYLLRGGVWGR